MLASRRAGRRLEIHRGEQGGEDVVWEEPAREGRGEGSVLFGRGCRNEEGGTRGDRVESFEPSYCGLDDDDDDEHAHTPASDESEPTRDVEREAETIRGRGGRTG